MREESGRAAQRAGGPLREIVPVVPDWMGRRFLWQQETTENFGYCDNCLQ